MNDVAKGKDIETAGDGIVAATKPLVETELANQLTVNHDLSSQPMVLPESGQLSPIQQMQMAKAAGLSIDDMKEMLKLQKEHEANEARKAFHAAMAEFKKNPPRVVKDMLNKQYDNSAYVSIGNMVNTVNEAMGPFGLNARWGYPESEDNTIVVSCILAHTLGHEETVTAKGMPDTSGKKNPLQEARSTRTYLKLDTFEAVTGMASVVGNLNDDGNASGTHQSADYERITPDQANQIHAKITDNDLNMQLFKNWIKGTIKVESIEDMPAEWFDNTMKRIEKAIELKDAK